MAQIPVDQQIEQLLQNVTQANVGAICKTIRELKNIKGDPRPIYRIMANGTQDSNNIVCVRCGNVSTRQGHVNITTGKFTKTCQTCRGDALANEHVVDAKKKIKVVKEKNSPNPICSKCFKAHPAAEYANGDKESYERCVSCRAQQNKDSKKHRGG